MRFQNKSRHLMDSGVWLVLFLLVAGMLYPAKGFSQSADSPEVESISPNMVPYETERSIGYHILAVPSYLLHWASRPIGRPIKYAETKFPHWFEGVLGPYGLFPLVKIGGEEDFAAGALLYHDHLFFKDHRARAEILFGSKVYNKFDLEYRIPVKGSKKNRLIFEAEYGNAPERAYYVNNRNEKRSYASEFGSLKATYRQHLNSRLQTQINVKYRDRTIRTSRYEDDADEQIPSSLLGSSKLITVGTKWTFNYKNGGRRTLSGTQYKVGAGWTQSTQNPDLKFLEYHGTVHHFVPIPLLPETRRLGVKLQLHKQENIGSEAIPFYVQNALGGSRDLRGFPDKRFRGYGVISMTAEYRYPIWDFMDAVIFTDQGQPFNNYSDIALSNFHSSYGFGFHLLSQRGLSFRSEFAFSKETSRFIISINPNF